MIYEIPKISLWIERYLRYVNVTSTDIKTSQQFQLEQKTEESMSPRLNPAVQPRPEPQSTNYVEVDIQTTQAMISISQNKDL